MNEKQLSSRQIFKATSLFGGVQVFSIIITVIRSKIIAVLLGPAGMGVAGLLTSTTGLIASLTNCGLGTSAIRDISIAHQSENPLAVSKAITVVKRLVWFTGLLGMIITLVASSYLSEITFGNKDYTLAFVILSLTVLFTQLTVGQDTLLQGMRKLKHLAKANIIGAVVGLLTSVPLYYAYGIKGIVPAILISSIATLLIAWFFAKSIQTQEVKISFRETFIEGKSMLRIGIILSFSNFITIGVSYLVRIYVSNTGGIADVGFFNAGFAIIGTYVGLVFTAMSTDYYPRLSGVVNDNSKVRALVNNQAEIAMLILSPILCVFLIFINWMVILLYSEQFIVIREMIHWAALGMYAKAISWTLGYILLAKGNSKIFLWNEISANIYILVFNVIGYKYYGLNGLGFAFMAAYITYFIQLFILVRLKYNFSFNKNFYKIFSIQLLLGILCFCTSRFIIHPLSYFVGTALILVATALSYIELDRLLDIKNLIADFKNRRNGK